MIVLVKKAGHFQNAGLNSEATYFGNAPTLGVHPIQLKVLHGSSFQIMLFFAQQKEGTPTIYLSSFFCLLSSFFSI